MRRKFIGRPPARATVATPLAGTTSGISRPAVASRAARAVPVSRRLRRQARRYRYSLTSIDVMFAAVAEPQEVVRAHDRKDHRVELYVFTFALMVLIASTIGLAVALRLLFASASTWLV